MDIDHLKTWIGRSERLRDRADEAPLSRLAALLDHTQSPWRESVPPLGHWLYFLPHARQSEIGEDGHPRRGGFLPPVPLPRRMWAGGRLRFHQPIALGAAIERLSVIETVEAKSGSSGDMVFVTIRHEIRQANTLAVEEWQDIVYRGAATAKPATAQSPGALPSADIVESRMADPVALFRFSALTFNAHRIHYDRDYATTVENYPGLVVHGPFSAMLLVDLFLRHNPGAAVSAFEFRARAPLFDSTPFTLGMSRNGTATSLWSAGPDNIPAMTATLHTGE